MSRFGTRLKQVVSRVQLRLAGGVARLIMASMKREQVQGFGFFQFVDYDDDRTKLVIAKLDACLRTFLQHDPSTYRRLRRSVRSFVITPLSGAGYLHTARACFISDRWAGEFLTVDELCCVIAHEAMHARIYDMGIGFFGPNKGRIERICRKAEDLYLQRRFREQPEQLQAVRRTGSTESWTDAEFRARATRKLREAGAPGWLQRFNRFIRSED